MCLDSGKCVCVSTCACGCVFMCMCMCVCMYVRACVCVWRGGRGFCIVTAGKHKQFWDLRQKGLLCVWVSGMLPRVLDISVGTGRTGHLVQESKGQIPGIGDCVQEIWPTWAHWVVCKAGLWGEQAAQVSPGGQGEGLPSKGLRATGWVAEARGGFPLDPSGSQNGGSWVGEAGGSKAGEEAKFS